MVIKHVHWYLKKHSAQHDAAVCVYSKLLLGKTVNKHVWKIGRCQFRTVGQARERISLCLKTTEKSETGRTLWSWHEADDRHPVCLQMWFTIYLNKATGLGNTGNVCDFNSCSNTVQFGEVTFLNSEVV